MFLALRDLKFARGRFALVGLVIGLVALMATLLSGLANGDVYKRQVTGGCIPGARVA